MIARKQPFKHRGAFILGKKREGGGSSASIEQNRFFSTSVRDVERWSEGLNKEERRRALDQHLANQRGESGEAGRGKDVTR